MLDYSPGSKMRQLINDEFQHERYTQFREWFFKKISKPELTQFKNEYYTQMNLGQDFIPFVKWFVNYFISKKKRNPCVYKDLGKMLEERKWKLVFPLNKR